LKVPAVSPPYPPELREHGVAAVVVAGDRTAPRRVPRGALVEQLGEHCHVGRVERLVPSADDLDVLLCLAHP
jgi:hypothetical protein